VWRRDDSAVPGFSQARPRLPLLIAAVALFSWWLLPGSRFERSALELGVRAFANPPFFITDHAKRSGFWRLRTVAVKPAVDPRHTPLLVSLGDDPEGVFQTSPPSPIDLAVVFTRLHRLGAENAGCAAALAWDAPDPIGLLALELALAEFESVVTAAPLGRGALAGTMPAAFRRASVGFSAVHGGVDKLPVVNRMILPDAVLGGDNAWAGFQFLENERSFRFMPLLARWEDRVVFAFPLLAAMRHLGVSLEEIEIRPGEFIRLGTFGPLVPIDRTGRLAVALAPSRGFEVIPAADLIDAPDDFLADRMPAFPVLRDDRGAAEAATRGFSGMFPSAMAVIAADTGLAAPRVIRRNGGFTGFLALAVWCALLTGVCRLPDFSRAMGFIALAGLVCTAQVLAVEAGHWLPGLPALAALAAAVVASHAPAIRRWFHRA